MFPTIVEIVNEDATWHKLIITDCAIRRYVIDFGYRPHSLDELVPKCLDIVPIDPFAGQPLSYQVTDGGYVLYSFGRNEKDDGATQSRFEGDIVFRSP
jgi:hypothetical protein